MESRKILVIEDEREIRELIEILLKRQGYQVTSFSNCEDLLNERKKHAGSYDLIVLDWMLPEQSGIEFLKQIRLDLDWRFIPVLMVTAKTESDEIILGLETGADDYLIKPYSIEELILKIEIFLNRSQKSTDNSTQKQYTFGSFHFEPENYSLKNESQNITLTEREASLLKLFLDNPNTVLKREKILMELWGSDDYFLGRSLDVFISRLRKIIKEETHVRIENIPRVGFKLVVE